MSQPLSIEVITNTPTLYYHCSHCEFVWQQAGVGQALHNEQLNAFPEDVKAEFATLSSWIRSLLARFGSQVTVRVVDAASIEGFWKSLRYRVRQYPTFIFNGRDKIVGFDPQMLEKHITTHLQQP